VPATNSGGTKYRIRPFSTIGFRQVEAPLEFNYLV
jgi:hypothetical protein